VFQLIFIINSAVELAELSLFGPTKKRAVRECAKFSGRERGIESIVADNF
jgi:hypothetical protein